MKVQCKGSKKQKIKSFLKAGSPLKASSLEQRKQAHYVLTCSSSVSTSLLTAASAGGSTVLMSFSTICALIRFTTCAPAQCLGTLCGTVSHMCMCAAR